MTEATGVTGPTGETGAMDAIDSGLAARPFRIRDTCRLCGSPALSVAVPLAPIPVISPNIDEHRPGTRELLDVCAPLDLHRCASCGLLQLTTVVDPHLQYDSFMYETSVSLGLREHFGELAASLAPVLTGRREPLVVEIGSNDGTLLAYFQRAGARVLGIDPARRIAQAASERGVPTIADFFSESLARAQRERLGPAAVVICNNTLANLDDLEDLVAGVRHLLADDGVFVFETQYGLDVLERRLLDVIYHEHLSYFTIAPLVPFFAARGLQLVDARRIWPKGGSIRVTVQKAGGPHAVRPAVGELLALEAGAGLDGPGAAQAFAQAINGIRARLLDEVGRCRAAGQSVAAYGSSVGCAALINQFGLGPHLSFVVDDTPFKTRLVGPGYDLPVLGREALAARMPALTLVLAWRYAGPIRDKNRAYLDAGGRFLVPLPAVSEP